MSLRVFFYATLQLWMGIINITFSFGVLHCLSCIKLNFDRDKLKTALDKLL